MEDGGAIYVYGQRSLFLASSTVTRNTADWDGELPPGNGGGVYLGTECATLVCRPTRLLLQNSIVADNIDNSPVDAEGRPEDVANDCRGTLTSDGFNLVRDAATGMATRISAGSMAI